MQTNYYKYLILTIIILIISWSVSCSGRSDKKIATVIPETPGVVEKAAIKIIKDMLPEENAGFKLGDSINVKLELRNSNKLPDSVLIYFDGKPVTTIKSGPWECTVNSDYTIKTGRKSLKVTAYKDGRSQNSLTRFMIIYSDIVPEKYGYRVVKSYPHDKHAFTQGLVYDNGLLYESTGPERSSSLREVELETGKVIRQLNLESTLFGEGIAIYKDRIYQVTYTNKVGFVYEKSSFNLINKIYYPTQGWGLTTLEDKIIMSDGSNILYFYEPEMFTVVSRIEVYDNEKKIDQLNELEYINGYIYANVHHTPYIVLICPETGKVVDKIDLFKILKEHFIWSDYEEPANGIACDFSTGIMYVTGKYWPKIYMLRVLEK